MAPNKYELDPAVHQPWPNVALDDDSERPSTVDEANADIDMIADEILHVGEVQGHAEHEVVTITSLKEGYAYDYQPDWLLQKAIDAAKAKASSK